MAKAFVSIRAVRSANTNLKNDRSPPSGTWIVHTADGRIVSTGNAKSGTYGGSGRDARTGQFTEVQRTQRVKPSTVIEHRKVPLPKK